MKYRQFFKTVLLCIYVYSPVSAMEGDREDKKRKIYTVYEETKSSDKNKPIKRLCVSDADEKQIDSDPWWDAGKEIDSGAELKDDCEAFDPWLGNYYYDLGSMYLDNLETSEDHTKMQECFKLASSKGHFEAQSILSKLYENWEMLPIELLAEIGSCLDNPADLYSFSLTCQNWRQACRLVSELNLNLTTENSRLSLISISFLTSLRRVSVYCTHKGFAGYIKSFENLKELKEFKLTVQLELDSKFIEVINTLTNLTFLSLEDSSEKVDIREIKDKWSQLRIQSILTYLGLPQAFISYPMGMPLTPATRGKYNYPVLQELVSLNKAINLEVLKIHQDNWHEWNTNLISLFPKIRELHIFSRPAFDIKKKLRKMMNNIVLELPDLKIYHNKTGISF